jgi:molybdopterin-guanine dinucleotide biosynthesis protein A
MTAEEETSSDSRAVGVVLAGGLARRMGGGDKGLLELDGRPILDHVIERLAPQVRMVIVNANGEPERFDRWKRPVAADVLPDNPGPLVGVLTGMDWVVANLPGLEWIVTVPTDAPFLPRDLVARFFAAVGDEGADMACAVSGGQRHPVCGLWPVSLRMDLRAALVQEGLRKVDVWTGRYKVADVDFSAEPVDPFFNANEPADLEEAKRLLATHG